MIEVVDGLDLSGVPVPFLEAYPFPAFVLSIPITTRTRPRLVSRDTDVTVRHYYDDVSPLAGPSIRNTSTLTIAWSNERWLRLTQGRSWDDMLDIPVQNSLQSWVEGDDEEESVFMLDTKDPGMMLYLSKTILPLTPPSATHSFCIITSQINSRLPVTPSDISSPGGRSFTMDLQMSSARGSIPSVNRLSISTETSTPLRSGSGDYFPPSERTSSSRSRIRRGKEPALSVQHMVSAAEEFWSLLESFDWSKTKLGPREQWAEAVGPLLAVTFQSKSADCLWLGDDLQLVYNKAYSTLLDHPASFGQPGAKVWSHIWGSLGPLCEMVMGGTPVYKEDDLYMIKTFAGGHKLEMYFTFRYVPIATRDGKVIGLYNQATDTTDKVLAERRLGTIREMSDQLLIARSTREYYDSIAGVFGENPYDSPFVLCYSVTHKETVGNSQEMEAKLESSYGVPEEHPSRQEQLNFSIPTRSRYGLGPNADRLSSPTLSAISAMSSGSGRQYLTSNSASWPIQKALASRQCVIVEDCSEIIEGYPLLVGDELPFAAAVVPICSDTSTDLPEAVIIVGLNSRRPLDAEYDAWIHVLRSQLASSLVSVKAYEAEKTRLDDIVRMEKAKTAWFRGAAHDLRSPLTLVNGPIEDVLGTELSSGQRAHLTTAKRNVDRLLRLVNSLLDFSRLEAGRMEARFVPVHLGDWVSNLAEVFRSAVERAKIAYHVDIQPRSEMVYIDPTLFETVVSNLIGNALKYTEQGRITVRLTFDTHAEISVIDTGVGIPQDEVPHVTDWFHRASTAIHSGTQGTGLGLALARELLKLHDGDLLVSSRTREEGAQGSTFTARIPLVQRIHADLDDIAQNAQFGDYGKAVAKEAMRWVKPSATEASSETGEDARSGSGSGTVVTKLSDGLLFEPTDTLLIVDDNLDMRNYIRSIFKRYCTVLEASDGMRGLEMARQHRPNLILSDIMMPRLSGMELLQKLRDDEDTRLIPIILLSAMQGDESRVEALIMGADDYLEKPFKPKELLARVHLHMQVGKKRVKLEAAFSEREAQIAILSDYCPSGIMRADATGAVTYANESWRKYAGMSADAEAATWPDYVTPDTVPLLLAPWADFLSGTEKSIKLQWKWLTGITVEGLFIRLDLMHSGMTGVLGCITDISYMEQRVLDAQERQREAEESRQQQELLIDLTSHEIRTPVSAILQCSSLVKENLVALKEQLRWAGEGGYKPTQELLQDLEEDVEALESIYQCGLVQERIAGDVLSLARIQLDMLSLYDIEMDLRKEARKVVSVFTSEAKSKKIDLVLEFGESMEMAKVAGIKSDPTRLGQVVTNLISNAMRFTASSEVRRITTTYNVSFVPPADDTCALPSSIGLPTTLPPAEDTPLWLFISVRDTGPGLGPKELAMLFKRFSQGNKMIHTRYGGSGLGLFICRKITEMLGGRIEVQSSLGDGSVFRFFIKTRAVTPPSAIAAMVASTSTPRLEYVQRQSETSGEMTPTLSMSSSQSIGSMVETDWTTQHILIVEDNLINQTVLKRQLVKAGLTCDVANNGLEALNLIREADRQAKRGGTGRKKRYNAVLMDLEMPVMDGLTAVKEIRAAETAGTLMRNMVIALTGNARQGQIDQALQAGMDDVVIKPYVLKNLLTKIRAVGNRRVELEQEEEGRFGR